MSFNGITPMGSLPAAAAQGYAMPAPNALAAGFPAQPAQPLAPGFVGGPVPLGQVPLGMGMAPTTDARTAADPTKRSLAMKLTSAVKAALKELGLYDGPVNGVNDAQLTQGILAFQAKNGLRQTGKADTQTRQKLSARMRARHTAAAQSKAVLPGAMQVQGTPSAAMTTQMQPGLGNAQAPTMGPAHMTSMPQGMAAPAMQTMPQGLAGPAMQTMPYMGGVGGFDPLTGFNGGVGALPATPEGGPQVNATNQGGLAMGANGAAGARGATQHVENRNTFTSEQQSRSPFLSPWGIGAGQGYGFGQGYGYGSLGAAAPYPYVGWGGATPGMSGVSILGKEPESGGIGGFFRKLLG